MQHCVYLSLLRWLSSKEPTCQFRRWKRCWFYSWVWKTPGGGNSNPLQYSCLENSMFRGAWQATVHGCLKEFDMTEQLTLLLLHIHHIFCIHTLIDWLVDYFHILAIVNNVAINVGMHIYLWHLVRFKFPLFIYPEMEFLNYLVGLFSIFWGTSILLCIVTEPMYVSTNKIQGFPFLHIFTSICDLLSSWW